jgi:CheY-like chemotaxis protein
MEAIGQLTGGIAHDFNNLLTIIKGGADFLKRGDISEARRARYVEAIADTADRAAKLTAQLLAFARRQSLEPVVFDVVERVNAVTEMLRPVMGSRIQVQVRAECDPCHVEADPNQLETAILNMSVNARDAMGGEGKLEITIAAVAGIPASAGAAAEEGSFVAIALTDTGSGIEPDKLERVFEPFFTTKGVGEGTGLGLSQVFGFAAQSGGHVRVESIVGAGSTFTLYLPKAEGEVSALGDREREAVSEDQPGGIVLIVEDNPQVADFACQLLADLGYEPHLAGNADQALDFLAAGRPVDVVFTDVVMPGISGVELGRKVQQMRPGLPVVITSGYSHILAEEGSQGFPLLHKPYSVDGLAKILRATLTREGAETHGMRQLVS